MLALIAKYIKDMSVLRRLLFAVSQLPPDLPNLWGIAVEFATQGKESRNQVTAEQVKVFVENIHALDATAFQTDDVILQDLVKFMVKIIIIQVNHCVLLAYVMLHVQALH